MDYSFGIALGAVPMTSGFQPGTQLTMVVDFPVVNNPKTLVFIADRLLPGLHVNDAEPPHRQANVFLDEEPFIIWSAMDDLVVHPDQCVALHRFPRVGIENSANSTHGPMTPFS